MQKKKREIFIFVSFSKIRWYFICNKKNWKNENECLIHFLQKYISKCWIKKMIPFGIKGRCWREYAVENVAKKRRDFFFFLKKKVE